MDYRIEKDSLGEIKVPKNAYFGSFTTRAFQNFQLSGFRGPREFIFSLGVIKQAAAHVNEKLGLLEKKKARAIASSSSEFAEGKFDHEFILDAFQAGAGTPFHMNANEIIANRANEILGGDKGIYMYVHPNNHVNLGQSSNDVVPTAIRITALLLLKQLYPELEKLIRSFKEKARNAKNILKVGRTHLQDAVPIKLSQEFEAFASSLIRTLKNLKKAAEELLDIQIGSTAVGTGINTHPRFRNLIAAELSSLTSFKFQPADDPIELMSNMTVFSLISSHLRQIAIDFTKIAQDLKLLNMGPKAGLSEITLSEVEPGSSIMPGKVNPSIAEAVHMAAYQVMGCDHTIALCCQAGQLQLNVMTPAILFNLAFALKLLINTTKMFREKCVDGIIFNEERMRELFDGSLCTATALSPYLGYPAVSALVQEALEKKKNIKDLVIEKGLMTKLELDKILSSEHTSKPSLVDARLVKKMQKGARN